MKNKKLNELTLEGLQNKQKKVQSTLIGAGIVVIILSVILLYLILKTGMPALAVTLPAIFLLMIVPGIVVLNNIKSEIKNRQTQL